MILGSSFAYLNVNIKLFSKHGIKYPIIDNNLKIVDTCIDVVYHQEVNLSSPCISCLSNIGCEKSPSTLKPMVCFSQKHFEYQFRKFDTLSSIAITIEMHR